MCQLSECRWSPTTVCCKGRFQRGLCSPVLLAMVLYSWLGSDLSNNRLYGPVNRQLASLNPNLVYL